MHWVIVCIIALLWIHIIEHEFFDNVTSDVTPHGPTLFHSQPDHLKQSASPHLNFGLKVLS